MFTRQVSLPRSDLRDYFNKPDTNTYPFEWNCLTSVRYSVPCSKEEIATATKIFNSAFPEAMGQPEHPTIEYLRIFYFLSLPLVKSETTLPGGSVQAGRGVSEIRGVDAVFKDNAMVLAANGQNAGLTVSRSGLIVTTTDQLSAYLGKVGDLCSQGGTFIFLDLAPMTDARAVYASLREKNIRVIPSEYVFTPAVKICPEDNRGVVVAPRLTLAPSDGAKNPKITFSILT